MTGHVTRSSNLIGWQTLSSAERVERQLSFLWIQQIGTLVEFQVWCWKSLKIRKTPLETSKWAQIPDLSRKHPCFDRKFSYQAQKLEIFRNYRSFHRGRGGYPRRRRSSFLPSFSLVKRTIRDGIFSGKIYIFPPLITCILHIMYLSGKVHIFWEAFLTPSPLILST